MKVPYMQSCPQAMVTVIGYGAIYRELKKKKHTHTRSKSGVNNITQTSGQENTRKKV